ncbi:hypothetical protein A2U01_0059858, partial [Trifolium medium]|nr:hypothetical protein [Trifolium medium]
FHCSLLKLHHGPPVTVADDLPLSSIDNNPAVQPLIILETKLDTTSNPPQQLVMVQWHGLPPEDTTWEKWSELSTTFHLEDKVIFPEDGSDTNVGRPKRNINPPTHLKDYVLKFGKSKH